MRRGGSSGWFALNFALLGWLVGRFAEMRRTIQESADTIRDQLAQLQDSQRRLLEAEKLAAVGRLAAGVAHEVRNPLGIIRSSASLLVEDDEPDEETARACTFIVDEVDRLNRFVTALLDFSRPTVPEIRDVNVPGLLDELRERAAPDLAVRGVSLDTTVEGSLAAAPADPDLLAQALLTLLDNAEEALEGEGAGRASGDVDRRRTGARCRG